MKFLAILAAASLAVAPVAAMAQATGGTGGGSGDDDSKRRPVAGPVAGHALAGSEIPAGAVAVGGLVLIGGAIIAVLGSSDANNNTNGTNTPAN